MSNNSGSIDRIIRVVAGLLLVGAGFFYVSGIVGIIMGLVGAVFLVTGLIGWCPMYTLFKINTRSE